ncbi:DNA-binding transcriptional regulator [Pseudomonas syringae pv. actinidiae]|uniref:DNA-binding transcriptional regulator n=1 Tax=Pseudomonas syringae pv. actinidiae TaxID=103796 RepID=A0AAN4Q280_PSESF|nr:DNA-binding transcriptional regulator [Pseudomonas syringae pv. actinidiae]
MFMYDTFPALSDEMTECTQKIMDDKICSGIKKPREKHLSPSRRQALRPFFVQTKMR